MVYNKRNLVKLLSIKVIAILFIYNLYAQNEKTEIQSTFESYFQTIKTKDNSKTLDYIYPKLFDTYPKDIMLKALNSMYEDTTKSINFDNSKIIKISNIQTIDGIKYALLKYSFDIKIEYLTKSDAENEETFDVAEFTFEILKNEHGDKNVTYDKDKKVIIAHATNELYAINDPKYSGWKFLENKKNLAPILEKILPINKLKKLKY